MRGSRAMLRRMESRALISSGCRVEEAASWGAKLMTTLTWRGPSRWARSTGGSCLKSWVSKGWTASAWISRAICLSLVGRLASISQLIGADAFGTVAHEPIDVVLALTYVEIAFKIGRTAGIFIDRRDVEVLGKIDRLVGTVLGRHLENHGERVLGPGQFLERHGDVVAAVELEVKAEIRLDRIDVAGEVVADVLGLQNGGIGGEQPDDTIGSGSGHQLLGGQGGRKEGRGDEAGAGQPPRGSGPGGSHD